MNISTYLFLSREILVQKQQYMQLLEEHNDLLELVAQQEIELDEFRAAWWETHGNNHGERAENTVIQEKAKRKAQEKYGSYIEYHNH